MHQTNGPSRLFRTPRLNVHVARRWMRALHVAVTASSLDLFHKQIFPILDYFLRAAYAFRGPLVLAVLSYLILSQPAQIQDLYFTTMSDDVGGWLRMLIIVVLLISLSIFLVTLVSVSDRFFRHPTKGTASISEHRLVKLVVGALPFAGALAVC